MKHCGTERIPTYCVSVRINFILSSIYSWNSSWKSGNQLFTITPYDYTTTRNTSGVAVAALYFSNNLYTHNVVLITRAGTFVTVDSSYGCVKILFSTSTNRTPPMDSIVDFVKSVVRKQTIRIRLRKTSKIVVWSRSESKHSFYCYFFFFLDNYDGNILGQIAIGLILSKSLLTTFFYLDVESDLFSGEN